MLLSSLFLLFSSLSQLSLLLPPMLNLHCPFCFGQIVICCTSAFQMLLPSLFTQFYVAQFFFLCQRFPLKSTVSLFSCHFSHFLFTMCSFYLSLQFSVEWMCFHFYFLYWNQHLFNIHTIKQSLHLWACLVVYNLYTKVQLLVTALIHFSVSNIFLFFFFYVILVTVLGKCNNHQG